MGGVKCEEVDVSFFPDFLGRHVLFMWRLDARDGHIPDADFGWDKRLSSGSAYAIRHCIAETERI